MTRVIGFVILMFITAAYFGCSGSHKTVGTMSDVNMSEWNIIGVIQPVVGKRDYEVPVVDQNTNYGRFRIVVYNWAVNIDNVQVTFDDGEVWEPDINYVFYAYSASDIIAIPKGPRKIFKIKVQIGNKSGMGQPNVYFWGGR